MNGHLTAREVEEVQSTPRYPGVVKKLAEKYNVSVDLIRHVRNARCPRIDRHGRLKDGK